MEQTEHASYSNGQTAHPSCGSKNSWMLTSSVPAPGCCCPLVASLLELHAASWRTVELALLFCSQWRLFYWHRHFPPEQQEVRADSCLYAWPQLCAAWTQLLSLVSSFPNMGTVNWLEPQVKTEGRIIVSRLGVDIRLNITDIAWHLQQVSTFRLSGSHTQGTLVACGGWHKQMNIQDLNTSLDLSWCMSSQTDKKRKTWKLLSLNCYYHPKSSHYLNLNNDFPVFFCWKIYVAAHHLIWRFGTLFNAGSYRDHHHWAHSADTCQRLGLQQVLKWGTD